jgi:hypothetical protein
MLMYIHIGERKIVSDRKTVGIFSMKTICNSDLNDQILKVIENQKCDIKTIVIDTDSKITTSKVSPFTVIKRVSIDSKECIWRRR